MRLGPFLLALFKWRTSATSAWKFVRAPSQVAKVRMGQRPCNARHPLFARLVLVD